MTEVFGDLWSLTNTTETSNYKNSTVTTKIPTSTYKFKPDLYIAQEGKIDNFLEYQIAWGIDTYYVPICSTLGIIGNTLCFLILMLSRSTTTYQYMAAISCTDTLILILNIMFLVRKFPGHEIFYTETCGLIFFLFYFAIHLNVALMVTMTAERYAAIRFPLKASRWFTIRKARVAILIQIFLVFTLDLHNFFTREMVEVDGGNSSICSNVGEMNTFFLTMIWPWIDAVWYCYFPLACLCVLNILIIYHIKKSGRIQRQMTQTGQTENTGKERQITIMLLLVTFCFLIFVGPMAMIIIIERYLWFRVRAQEHALYFLVRTILNYLMYTNHALNFLLYFMSGQRFRNQAKETLCICRRSTLGTYKPEARAAGNTGSSLSVATLSTDVSKSVAGSQLSVNNI
ncbi:hypothetical protein LOTGIDRAFT_172511 [Lottia gigantea]|uniref:G-protein coupled receptors family 1 profile domain-containing protein n=1 Tax=Lottia gigantea TaxID=225164 RepID=V4B6G8_LOTGI|nr:hypothetical protein LOTGIDRAFT_172511 [Lottia gigantea]ESP01662.1 hypothetical protein LOTGIDRAFT_172511 [Lottia gigantea]